MWQRATRLVCVLGSGMALNGEEDEKKKNDGDKTTALNHKLQKILKFYSFPSRRKEEERRIKKKRRRKKNRELLNAFRHFYCVCARVLFVYNAFGPGRGRSRCSYCCVRWPPHTRFDIAQDIKC